MPQKMEEKIIIIMNPSSGSDRALKQKEVLETLLRKKGVNYELFLSQSEDHLRELAKKNSKRKVVCAAGGDSTITIVLDELLKKNFKGKFGLIGLGSSDDLMRDLGVFDLNRAVDAISQGKTKKCDVIEVQDDRNRHVTFLLGQVNLGLGALVNAYVEDLKFRKKTLGKKQNLAGLIAIYKSIRSKNLPQILTISLFGARNTLLRKIQDHFQISIISKIRYWASGLIFVPQARNDDGLLHLVLQKPCGFFRQLQIALQAKKAEHIKSPLIEQLKAERIHIESIQPFVIQVDGDIIGKKEGGQYFQKIKLSVIKKAVNIFIMA